MDMFSPPADTAPTAYRDVEILIVDDSRTNLQIMGQRLSHMGYRTAMAESGPQALDLIQGRAFDLVLLDMVMPGMSGIGVLHEIRLDPNLAALPVLMITARSDKQAEIEALTAGADDHVAKPFDFDVLAARIDRLIERSRTIRSLQRSNDALDARVARRAMEIGELRHELDEVRRERQRLAQSLMAMTGHGRPLPGSAEPARPQEI